MSDASDVSRPDATEVACPGRSRSDAGKSAVPALDAQVRDEAEHRLAPWAVRLQALYKPDAAQSAEQSFAAVACAGLSALLPEVQSDSDSRLAPREWHLL